jgi:hypothetical protein
VNTIAVQSDGKILVGGLFTSYKGGAANSSNRIARLDSDGTFDSGFSIGTGFNHIEASDWLQTWDRTATGRGTSLSYFEGNIKTCADKGMRLPTMYETTMTQPASTYLPTGYGITPTWAGSTNGVPGHSSWTWTASADTSYTSYYWIWSGASSSFSYYDYSLSVRCVLPSQYDHTRPGAPTGLTATSASAQEVNLTWAAPTYEGSHVISDYIIQYSSDNGITWTSLSRAASTSTSDVPVRGFTRGTNIFRVAAVNASGAGFFSAASSSLVAGTLACSGDCYLDSAATTEGLAMGPGDVEMDYVFATGSSGFKIWKEKGGSRILNATGLVANGWQKQLARAGTSFTSTDFTVSSNIAGRVCPPNVFLDHNNMTVTGRCLYYDHGNEAWDMWSAAATHVNTIAVQSDGKILVG